MPTNAELTVKMVSYGERHKLIIPKVSTTSDVWGLGKRTLAWRVSGHLKEHGKKVKQSARRTAQLVNYFFPLPHYSIRRDYHAVHHSGTRPLSAIDLIVLHDIESTNQTGAAEGAGSWFENQASGGSTQYGIDNDSIQQYLADNVICWGAPYANTNGLHIEQMGVASWSESQWKSRAKGTLDRTAWLIAKKSQKLGIPIRTLSDKQVRSGSKGIVTHAQLTRVHGISGGHTDPGKGYPLGYVLDLARKYRELM
jgi:hypothetical protein